MTKSKIYERYKRDDDFRTRTNDKHEYCITYTHISKQMMILLFTFRCSSILARFLQGTNLLAQSRDFHQRERVFAKVFFRGSD